MSAWLKPKLNNKPMSRNNLILTGLVGLVGAVFLTALSLWIINQGWLPILVTRPLYVWGLFLFLLAFSVVEIPVMLFGLRRIAASPNSRATSLVLLTNAGYIFFGAIYALPLILLTGRLGMGVALAALAVIRFFSSLYFLLPRERK
jgi:hypothetical protein